MRLGGKIRDAKALLKIAENSSLNPPIPRSSNLKTGEIIDLEEREKKKKKKV